MLLKEVQRRGSQEIHSWKIAGEFAYKKLPLCRVKGGEEPEHKEKNHLPPPEIGPNPHVHVSQIKICHHHTHLPLQTLSSTTIETKPRTPPQPTTHNHRLSHHRDQNTHKKPRKEGEEGSPHIPATIPPTPPHCH